jgi:hypothetical protein
MVAVPTEAGVNTVLLVQLFDRTVELFTIRLPILHDNIPQASHIELEFEAKTRELPLIQTLGGLERGLQI